MREKIFVAVLVLITAAYAWGLGWIAWGFVRAGSAVGYGLALGIGILLLLTIWVTWREMLFGMGAGRLARSYEPPAEADGDDPRAEFEAARTALQDGDEQDWRAWFRLALAYDAMRDRKGARMATRRAIDEHRRRPQSTIADR
ncbi:MAG: hypothetical protein ACTMII_01165 [Brachybacterium sp.]|uniref:hypothetical protein n=1 Tax=unclassified Brachybacterium TaxID=2623841 RepID=UPI003F91164D